MAKQHKDRHTKYKFRWTCGGGQGSRRGCGALQKKKGKARRKRVPLAKSSKGYVVDYAVCPLGPRMS